MTMQIERIVTIHAKAIFFIFIFAFRGWNLVRVHTVHGDQISLA